MFWLKVASTTFTFKNLLYYDTMLTNPPVPYTVNRFQGRQRRVYGESLLPVSRVEFFRLALYYLTMFGMNMVKVIHEELILLLVLDFDDVFDLHQEWSVSTEESA